MTVDEADCTDNLQDLSEKQLQTLHDWEVKLQDKYAVVGKVRLVGLITLHPSFYCQSASAPRGAVQRSQMPQSKGADLRSISCKQLAEVIRHCCAS